jgi:glycosyltransferase involved in cell wall biosynthesis
LIKVLVLLDNDLFGDNRVLREIDILKSHRIGVLTLCYDYKNEPSGNTLNYPIKKIRVKKSLAKKLLPLENRFGLFTYFWKKHIIRAIKTFNPTHILAHDLYMAKPARKAIETINVEIKLILDLHENYPFAVLTYGWVRSKLKYFISVPTRWKSKEGKYLKMADKIMVLSDSFAEDLTRKYAHLRKDKFIVFPNLPDISKLDNYPIKPEILPKISNPIMFYFGVIGERRGIFDSLEAFKEVIKKGTKLNYLIAGPIDKDDKNRFQKYMVDPEIEKHVHYISWIDIKALPTYLQFVDFCVAPFKINPQHESGIANKIFQYMYGKKAVLVSNCRPQAELIRKSNGGRVYTNQLEFENHINDLANNLTLTHSLGENAFDYLMNYPDHEEDFVQLFKSNLEY